jgi:hypothetical protein
MSFAFAAAALASGNRRPVQVNKKKELLEI